MSEIPYRSIVAVTNEKYEDYNIKSNDVVSDRCIYVAGAWENPLLSASNTIKSKSRNDVWLCPSVTLSLYLGNGSINSSLGFVNTIVRFTEKLSLNSIYIYIF